MPSLVRLIADLANFNRTAGPDYDSERFFHYSTETPVWTLYPELGWDATGNDAIVGLGYVGAFEKYWTSRQADALCQYDYTFDGFELENVNLDTFSYTEPIDYAAAMRRYLTEPLATYDFRAGPFPSGLIFNRTPPGFPHDYDGRMLLVDEIMENACIFPDVMPSHRFCTVDNWFGTWFKIPSVIWLGEPRDDYHSFFTPGSFKWVYLPFGLGEEDSTKIFNNDKAYALSFAVLSGDRCRNFRSTWLYCDNGTELPFPQEFESSDQNAITVQVTDWKVAAYFYKLLLRHGERLQAKPSDKLSFFWK